VRRARRELTPEERRRRWLRGGLYGCGGCLAAALVTAVVVVLLIKAAPPMPPELEQARREAAAPSQPPTATGSAAAAPAAPTAPSAAAAAPPPAQPASVREQLQALEHAQRQGYKGSFRIVVSEADLNREIANSARDMLKDAVVAILDGEILLAGTATAGPTPAKVLVRAHPSMHGNQPRVVITQAYLGRMPAPGGLVKQVQAELDKAVQKALAEARGVTVTNLAAQRGIIVIQGYLTE